MTKEELEKEAKDYAEENKMNLIDYHDGIGLEEAYIAGAEPREKRIAELEAHIVRMSNCLKAQIEKMKCDLLELRNDSYDAGMYLRIDELIQKWEIKENDRY